MRPDPSVMANRAPAIVAADDDRTALFRRLNYFPTPLWAGRAGAELVLRLDPEARYVWEPACGEGHLVEALADYFPWVRASDIHEHDGSRFGSQTVPAWGWDFLADACGDDLEPVDWIITNPPFEPAAEFTRLALRRARRGVAMLCRLNWIESAGRYPLFFGEHPLAVFAPFAERVPMTLGRWDPAAGSATGYAWFVWMQGRAWADAREAGRLPCGWPVVMPIEPGTKARLTRPDDARLWGVKADAPLFEGVGDG